MAKDILVKAARLWDGVSSELVHHAFLLVKDGKIATIGRQTDLGETGPGDIDNEVYDLGDTTLLPGLINLHTHLTFSGSNTVLADYMREKAAGLPTLTIRAVDNMQRSLQAGVTTIRDCGTLNEVVFAIRAAVENGTLLGPRVVASGHGITTTGGHCYYFSHEADSADEVRKAVRSQVKAGADFIKIFSTGGGLTPGTNMFAAQYTAVEMKAATEEARRLGRLVASHAHGTPRVRNSIAARVNTIEHCTFMTPSGVDYEPEMVEEIAEAGIYVVPTLSYSMTRRMLAPNYQPENPGVALWLNSRFQRYENFRKLHAAGVKIVSGSDSGVTGVPFEDYPSDLSLLVNEVGFSAYQTLLSATSLAAQACGLNDTGVLAPGKRADLLAVAGNPLENIADLEATQFVAVAGRVALWNKGN